MALMLCKTIDEATQQCLHWVEYAPLIPDLTNDQIGVIWFWFMLAECCAWGGKKLVRMWGL